MKLLASFVVFIFRPFFIFGRFLFFKILVKLYLSYFSIIKKLGWAKVRGSFLAFLFGQKTVHLLVVILTIYVSFLGFVGKGKAKTIFDSNKKTILANVVRSEFSEFQQQEEFIEEGFDDAASTVQAPLKYLSLGSLENKPRASLIDEEINEGSSIIGNNTESIIKPDIIGTEVSQKKRTKPLEYVVQPGDTISTLAQEFGVSVNTILWENNLSSISLIRPGDEITILPASGISHTVKSGENLGFIAKKYDITVDDLMKANRLTDSSSLSIGQELFVAGGVKTPTYVAKKEPAYNPISTIKNIVSSKAVVPSNKMTWPTEGHRLTQYYSWRHLGLDIANKTGTPIYAADAGTVTYSGWSTGYGYRIDIDHGGGKKTRYAHHSQLYVKVGQQVAKGQTIGAMGSTGWSTGPHLHFEVIIGGNKYNPLNYIQ